MLLLLLVFAVSCGGGGNQAQPTPESGSYGAGVDLDVGPDGQPQEQAAQPQDGGQAAPAPAAPEQGGGEQATGGGTDGAGGSDIDTGRRPRDDFETGANAVFYLRPEHPKLTIELTAVNGREPDRASLEMLHSRLSSVLDKPDGIEVTVPKTFTSSKSTYTLDDIKRLEQQYREHHSGSDGVAMHFLFLNGSYTNESVLGIAYRAGSIAIFTDRIRGASTPLVGPEAIMRSVLVHEAGHLLRLVGNGYDASHEDPEHPGHTRHSDGVMYWAVESVSVAAILEGGPPTRFHPDSLADLEAIKAGRV